MSEDGRFWYCVSAEHVHSRQQLLRIPPMKPLERPSSRIRPQTQKEWKDHPLVVAALSVAGTATLFATVVMPLSNSLLNTKVEKLTEVSANASATAEELVRTKRELTAAQAAFNQVVGKSPLANGSVYPVGADDVVIGTTADDVLRRLAGAKWDEDVFYISAPFKNHPVFSGAAYYFEGKDKRVSAILYHFHSSESISETVRKYLLTTFGEPTKIKKRSFLWRATAREWVSLEGQLNSIPHSYSYYVYKSGAGLLSAKWD